MPRKRSWTDDQLIASVATCFSYRSVIKKLGLIPAGGNYVQTKMRVYELGLSTTHFTGKKWSVGTTYHNRSRLTLDKLLTVTSNVQSYKLKKRLYEAGLRFPKCELCGWCEQASDGRIPVELDHINGIHSDNRLDNLRILCPNCHSLQATHRGKNKGRQ